MISYPLLDIRVSTPTLELRAATDALLDQLAEVVSVAMRKSPLVAR